MSTVGEIHIRLAQPSDIPSIRALEHSSDQIFRNIGMDAISECEPPSFESYSTYQSQDHLWIATLSLPTSTLEHPEVEASLPVGFIQVDIYENDGIYRSVYIHQLSVSPEHARRGIGRELIKFVEVWANGQGFSIVDLTTFGHVPWNRAYYERLGFSEMTEEELNRKDARDVKEEKEREERDALLGRWARVAMRKYL